MIRAVVYESHTGFARTYAKMMAYILDVKAYSQKEAERELPVNSDIVFFGWVCSGKVMGYDNAARAYNIVAVCAVGMKFLREGLIEHLTADSRIVNIPVFYMQGGFRHDQQGLIYRTMIKMMATGIMEKKDKTEYDYKVLRYIREGANLVNEDNLIPVTEYLEQLYGKERQEDVPSENP